MPQKWHVRIAKWTGRLMDYLFICKTERKCNFHISDNLYVLSFFSEQNTKNDYPDVYVVMVYFWIIFGLSYLALIIQQIGKILTSTGKVVQERVSTTVSTVATASMATGRVVHDRVSKQFSHIKDSIGDAHIRYSSSDEEGGTEGHSKKRKPSKRLHYRPSKKGPSTPGAPEIQISPSPTEDPPQPGFVTDEKTTETTPNGTNNGNLSVVDPTDAFETESTTTAVSLGHDNDVALELDEMNT